MPEPYRAPEVPSGADAMRGLAEHSRQVRARGVTERARRHRRRLLARRTAIALTSLMGLALIACVVLRAGFDMRPPAGEVDWVGLGMIINGIGAPLGLLFAFGMKIPPRPGDAPSAAAGTRLGGG